MNIRKLTNLGLLGPVLLSFLVSTQLFSRVEERFSTTGPGLLTLQLQSSSIDVDTYGGSEVSIEITRMLKRGDQEDFDKELKKLDLTFEQSGNDISCTLAYENKSNGWNWLRSENRLNFKTVVRIPKSFDLNAKTSDGSIDLKNLKGDVTLRTSGGGIIMETVDSNVIAKTSGGGIRAKDCNGDVEMKTSDGSIKADNIAGRLLGHTSGGNITANNVQGNTQVSTSGGSIRLGTIAGNLEATTSGGSITATIAGQPTEDCYLKTSGGSINVSVNQNANLEINASTSGGSVTTQLQLTGMEAKRSSMRGRLNAGGPTLKTRTSGGSIHINSN